MKAFLFFFLLKVSKPKVAKEVGIAISEIVKFSFEENIKTIDIVTFGTNENLFNETISTILSSNEEKVFIIKNLNSRDKLEYINENSAVFLFDSVKFFESFALQQALQITYLT